LFAVVAVLVPASIPTPAEGFAADRLRVNPLLALAVVPVRFVRFNCGFPWECVEFAAVVSAL
jgi:hypothetical protein